MAETERTYTIPLRKQVNKSPFYKRAKKAISTVKIFLEKHMKSKDVKLGQMINKTLWKRGITNPPGKIKVTVTKDDKGLVKAELFGHKYVDKVKVEKVEKSKLEQLKEKLVGKTEEVKEDVNKEHNKEAITNVPENKEHDHAAHEHSEQAQHAEEKKERKISKNEAKSKDKR